jgi:hypothetical protein
LPKRVSVGDRSDDVEGSIGGHTSTVSMIIDTGRIWRIFVVKSVSTSALCRRSQLTAVKAAEAEADVCEYDIDNISRGLSIFHSCLDARTFVDEVHATLPREIRDMIWNYVLDSEPKAVKRLDQVLVETAMHARTCEKLADGPWFVQACFVGPWARVDVLELRYRRLFTTIECSRRDISLLYDLATVDAYHTGLKPMLFVRHLVLQWDMGRDSGKARRDPK